jgi:DNA repair exonuclease SbcCD ATPase subunit
MIIRNVRAENILKYAHLELNRLPAPGLIAISGRNESGKSTIGETVCFALFGRTFSLRPEELGKLIRWGETRCLVALDFSAADGCEYRVERSLDEAGNQGATLTRIGQDDAQARGPEAVTAEIVRLAGFGYNEFIESFYLAQREMVAPHAHSAAIKAMAGLTPLEQVHAQISDEVKTLTDNMISAERDLAEVNDRLGELNFNPEQLGGLWTDLSNTGKQQREKSIRARRLRHVSEQCHESVKTLNAASAPILKASANTSYQGWRAHSERLEAAVETIDQNCAQQDAAFKAAESTTRLKDFSQHLKSQLDRFGQLKERAADYRGNLVNLLGDSSESNRQTGKETSLPAQKADFTRRAERAKKSRRITRGFLSLFFILTLALFALWVLLFQAPDNPVSTSLTGWLNLNFPAWRSYRMPLLWTAIGAAAIFVLLFIRGIVLSSRLHSYEKESTNLERRIEATREEAAALEQLEIMPLPDAVALLKNAKDEELAAQAEDYENDASTTLLKHESLNDYRRLLTQLTARSENDAEAVRADIANKVAELEREVRTADGAVTKFHQDIPVEQERRRKAERLQGLTQGLQSRIDEVRHKIEVRNLGRDLLEDGIQHVSRRFNHEVRNLVGKTLPLLTSNRYEHLQIDEALRVRVFSGEKHDFLDLDEISSGTQRQIMLAVRLALAQQLVHNAVDGKQFIFLDEPFAFFDEQRMRDSLAVLPTLSGEITQTFIVAQEFSGDAQLDLHIPCDHDQADLRVGAA